MNAPFLMPPRDFNASGRRPGLIGRSLVRKAMQPAEVARVERLSGPFVIVDLCGAAVRATRWSAGQRASLIFDQSLAGRTYTPFGWDREGERVRFMFHVHGKGVASEWAWQVGKGDACGLVGPAASIETPRAGTGDMLFGDETSIATALSGGLDRTQGRQCVFEATDVSMLRQALSEVGLQQAQVIARRPDLSHLDEVRSALASVGDSSNLTLTGNARSIQRLHQLRGPSFAVRTKAYWSPGKSGLT